MWQVWSIIHCSSCQVDQALPFPSAHPSSTLWSRVTLLPAVPTRRAMLLQTWKQRPKTAAPNRRAKKDYLILGTRFLLIRVMSWLSFFAISKNIPGCWFGYPEINFNKSYIMLFLPFLFDILNTRLREPWRRSYYLWPLFPYCTRGLYFSACLNLACFMILQYVCCLCLVVISLCHR